MQLSSVIFCRSFSASFSSSSVISEAFCIFLNLSMASRRMLRTATLPFSEYLWICFTSSLRRSSVSWGKDRRMHLPSFWGLMPRSDSRMAFSMARSKDPSQGVMTRVRGSGDATLPTCWMGVGVP